METRTGKDAWLSGFAENSVKVYKNGYSIFIEFMNKTEKGEWDDQRIITERIEDVQKRSYAFEHKIIEFYSWLKEYNLNFSDNTRKSYLRAVRSFFSFHRLDVNFTHQQKTKISKKPKPKRKYYDFTVEDIKKMFSVSKPKERYILIVGKELGLRASDFASFKQGTFTAHLTEEPPIPLGDIYTIKEGVTAKPFLGFDGREAAKQWLTVLKSEKRYDPDKPMIEISEKELSQILKRLARRAGVNTGNEKIRFHQLRVFLITRLAQIMETNRWKQIVGKEVPESAYVKPLQLRENYKKVLPLITVDTRVGMPQKEELEKLENAVLTLNKDLHGYRTTTEILTKKVEKLEGEIDTLKGKLADSQVGLTWIPKAIELGITAKELKMASDFMKKKVIGNDIQSDSRDI
ncbi:hypothetical protein ACFLRN_09335 [Thermoproteota archaeon]